MTQSQSPTGWLSVILFAVFLTIVSTPVGAKEMNPAEKWVIEQVTAGNLADLRSRFPDERDRKLGARFLEDLLTGMLPGVKPHRNGVRIQWAIIDELLDLTNAQIPWEVWLDNCQFSSGATFARANFAGTVSFSDSTFRADANYYGMKVGHTAFFRKTIFEGAVNLLAAEIASNLEADRAHFKNKEQEANFNSMKVGHSAFFVKAVFEGPVDFVATEIASVFQLDEAQFKNKQQAAHFNDMKVGRAFLRKAIFEGPVDFAAAEIASGFDAQEAHFKNKEQDANFNGIKVGTTVFFRNAVFEGPVDFISAAIATNFEAQEAQFRSKTQTVQLRIKCEGRGIFTGVTFAGPVSFENSNFLALVIGGTNAEDAPIPQLDLSRSSIKRQLVIEKIRIHDLVASSLHVEGPANFTDVIVEYSADLSDANFATLDLSRSVWPKHGHDGQAFQLRGMNYKYLRADANESTSHDTLLKLADHSAFAADVYGNMEAFFLRQGYGADADRAFIAGKRRERGESLHRKEYLRWLGSKLLDYLVGHGRHPSQAGYFCAFFVGLGVVLFSPKKMELQKSDAAPRIYNRFWYSLGVFLPIVNLEADKVWKPKSDQTLLRNYMRVHILLGWILIPIFVAALTGLIK